MRRVVLLLALTEKTRRPAPVALESEEVKKRQNQISSPYYLFYSMNQQ